MAREMSARRRSVPSTIVLAGWGSSSPEGFFKPSPGTCNGAPGFRHQVLVGRAGCELPEEGGLDLPDHCILSEAPAPPGQAAMPIVSTRTLFSVRRIMLLMSALLSAPPPGRATKRPS